MDLGRAVQVNPIKPRLKAPGTKRLKLKHEVLISTVTFNFNLHRYALEHSYTEANLSFDNLKVGRCRLTRWNPFGQRLELIS